MTMLTDVKAVACAAGATTEAYSARTRLKGLLISYPVAGGTVTVADGTGGLTIFSFTSPAGLGTVNVLIPGDGILATLGLSVTCAASTTATVFYG